MNEQKHFASRLLCIAGGLLAAAGILLAICVRIAYGGLLWAGAACMFFAARSFYLAENEREKKKRKEGYDNED